MLTPQQYYNELLSNGLPANKDSWVAVRRLGDLVDLSLDLQSIDGIRTALAWSDNLIAWDLSTLQLLHIHYFIGNAWSHLDRLQQESEESTWRWERAEVEKEVFHLRKAARLAESVDAVPELTCQIHTNLGNALSKVGRFVEALDHWDSVFQINPDFGMAAGNRGYGLLHYARHLFDPGHRALFIQAGRSDLRRGLDGSLDTGARQIFERELYEAERFSAENGIPMETRIEEFRLGETEEEVSYRKWCLRNRLFINPLNDLSENSIAAIDVLHLPPMRLRLDEPPSLLGFFNQLKQEYVSARYMLYQGVTMSEPHYSDKDVAQVDTLDYPIYSIAIERTKVAFRVSYSILDKIAFLLDRYLGLNLPERNASFRTCWYENQQRNRGLRSEFQVRENWPLRGLYWLSKDLSEKRADFVDAMSPDAREIVDIRNHAEHKYLKVHDDIWQRLDDAGVAGQGFRMDDLSKSIARSDFQEKALRLLKLTRAALIYTSLAVYTEERQKHKSQDERVGTMPTRLVDHDWKR